MKKWYYIAAYLTSLAGGKTIKFRFTLRMLANRLGVDEETALQAVDEWLEEVKEAKEKELS